MPRRQSLTAPAAVILTDSRSRYLRAEAERSYATFSSAEKLDGAGAPKGHFVAIGSKHVGMLE